MADNGKTLQVMGRVEAPAIEGDSGYDLRVQFGTLISPYSYKRVALNGRVAIPEGFWGLVIARSSTNANGHLLVLPGVIDFGYRGPLFAFVHNLSGDHVRIAAGDRICQLVLVPMAVFPVQRVNELPVSVRGEAGMGSTGT